MREQQMSDENEIPSYVEYTSDITDAKPPAPLPVGKYHASIVDAKINTSTAKGTKYYAPTFLVSPDQYPADYVDGPPDGTKIVYRRVSAEDNAMARFMTSRFCKTIGAPTGRRVDTLDWIGRTCTVEIAHTTYEGQTRHEIKNVEPA